MVNETFKDFAHSVCAEYELQYSPLSHEDALYLYRIREIFYVTKLVTTA